MRSRGLSGWALASIVLFATTSLAAVLAGAADASDSSSAFYEPEVIQNIRLEIAPAELDRLRAALPKRIYVPATFRWNDLVLTNVGVRYKGGSSSNPDSPHKRSFLIAFSEFSKGQRFLGLRHVALDNGIQFGGLFSERLITEVLRGVGVKASRCNYARLSINDKSAGVYVNVERLDRSFLERRFADASGPLFKVDEEGHGADLRLVGDDPDLYRKTFELHSGGERAGFASLVSFMKAIELQPTRPVDLEKVVDVDAFTKTTAVLLLAGAFDQYTGWGPHNYYLYRDPADGRWTYLPWDLDVGFADRAFNRIPVLEGWNAAWPAPIPGRPLMEHLISNPVRLEAYRSQARTILETWFRPEVLIPKLHRLREQLRPILGDDPFPQSRATVPSDRGMEDVVTSMERFIQDRYNLARSQLEHPGPRPAPMPDLPGAGPPGFAPGSRLPGMPGGPPWPGRDRRPPGPGRSPAGN